MCQLIYNVKVDFVSKTYPCKRSSSMHMHLPQLLIDIYQIQVKRGAKSTLTSKWKVIDQNFNV